jgi:hypothetical protein
MQWEGAKMSKNGPEGQESARGRQMETTASDRAKSRRLTAQADEWIEDALEDDEVREALKPHHEGTGA